MRRFLILFLAFHYFHAGAATDAVRLKELGRIDGWRENYLVGFGMVTGLAGTGDSARNKATRQSLSNLMSNFDMTITSDQVNSRNVALVSVVASLPPVTRPGDRVDVIVTSLGDARSLVGGTLLLAPLKGPDNRVYALAQGPVSIGGYRYDQSGNLAQKNHPTVGTIPGGAQIESKLFFSPFRDDGSVDFVLNTPNYTTVRRAAEAINVNLGNSVAVVRDSGAVHIQWPTKDMDETASLLATIENISIVPDVSARVVINERTGTIVAGGDVRISNVTIAHGDIKISIATDYQISQPTRIGWPSPSIGAEVVPDTRVSVEESEVGLVELAGKNSVADLVRALNRIRVSTRDIIAILQGIKTAGALHAELVVQ